MQQWADAVRRLLEDPAQNAAAIATGVAVIVLFVVIIVLLLVALALPTSAKKKTAAPAPAGRRLPPWATTALIVVVVVGLIVSATVLWYSDTASNKYCTSTCHAMALATESWAVSAHAEVDCVRCHEGRKWENFFGGVGLRAESLYLQATGAKAPGRRVPADICLSCHKSVLSRPVTGRNGEPFNHSDLERHDLNCPQCHGAQGHVPARP